MKRPYIPLGVTQQGRQRDGARATCPDVERCAMPLCACHPMAAEPATDIGAEQIQSMRDDRRVAGWVRAAVGLTLLLLAIPAGSWAIGVLCSVSTLCNP